jgi:LPXTG-motif cell wall-anchored protein
MGILGRLTAALVTAVALSSASVGAVGAAPAATDPYSAKITTRTIIRTPSPIETHTRITMTVKVTANSPTQPTGELRIKLTSAPRGNGQARTAAAGPAGWTRTIAYNGGTKHIVGPAFPKTGDWLVTAVFTPDDNQFRSSRDGWTFEVVAAADDTGPGDDTDDNDGLLPDTGGPALLWLLLGLGLLGAGAAAVVFTRRRRTSATAVT